MDKIRIKGGTPLKGNIRISGAKNAALKLMCASLLTDGELTLTNMPHLQDVTTLANLLGSLGVDISITGDGHQTLTLQAGDITSTRAEYDLVRKMRASILVLGPLLARFHQAEVSLPGGCAIGARPVDLHLKALEALGAKITIEDGYVKAKAPKGGLHGADHTFAKVSVGATENLIMAASLANGTTILRNAAKEPEIGDLANCLNKMGANITGIDTDTLTIKGVDRLSGAEHSVLPDRIETATYAMAAAITQGEVTLTHTVPAHVESVLQAMEDAGAKITRGDTDITVKMAGKPKPVDITTAPFPGFATDAQAQFMAWMSLSSGASSISETIFENRFMHVPELQRMGTDITITGNTALIRGVESLKGAPVMATDLRASVALVLAGLAAEGETVVSRVYHLDRGYEHLEQKLSACGANIQRIRDTGDPDLKVA